ncbi:LTA synthase family protein [Hafnia paralvei]|uniref:LTA synthase family protein n=2 Tax=Hafnia paralvei TaxID=546367 RepID=UPI003C6FDD4E
MKSPEASIIMGQSRSPVSSQQSNSSTLNRFKQNPKTCLYCLFLVIVAVVILAGNTPSAGYPLITALSAFVFIVCMFYLLSGRSIFALSITSLLVIVLQFINQLKVHYYKDHLMFPDIYLATDPSNTATLLHYPLAGLALLGLVIWLIITLVVTWRATARNVSHRVWWRSIGMMILASALVALCVTRYQHVWATTLPGGTGVVSNLVMSASEVEYEPPSFNSESSAYFKQQAAALNLPLANHSQHQDIIVLLQESTVDPRLYSLPDPKLLPRFTMFEQGGNVKAHTPMRVQTFGGGTWLSEFALLTGLRSDDFGAMKNSVFYSAVDHVNDSLFKQMKNNGYYTIVLTPFNKSAYNAGHAYHEMGIDQILQPQELGYPGKLEDNLWHITTADMLKYVKQIMAKKTDKPLFIYALTMYEHGPYDEKHSDDYHLTHYVKKSGSAGEFSHYVEKIKTSDTALADFFQFVDTRNKPTIFMHFGDHQPAIDWSNGYTTTMSDPMHFTQFSLRDNTGAPAVSDLGRMTDIAFLGGMVLEHANLSVSPFYRANIEMRHLCKGELNDCTNTKLVESYKHYIYSELHAASGDSNP